MDKSPAPQPFDIESWYTEFEANAPKWDQHPSAVLLQAIGKDTSNWCYGALYSKKHPRYKKPNGAENAIRRETGFGRDWQKTLDAHNAAGRRIYFTPNEGGQKWKDITACHCHFYEYDNLNLADYYERDWDTFADVGWFKPSADVFSGSRSPHGYDFLKKPYTNPYRWVINQIRINAVLGSDPSIYDPSRLMRLPGFDHTDDEGNPVRKALLVQCDTERRYSIAEIEAKLMEHERARNICIFDLLDEKSLCFNPDHRPGIINALLEIFGEGIEEEFEDHFKVKSKGTEHFVDGRSFQEIKDSFAKIPPYEPGNSTYDGKEPVTTADGQKVKIRYFSMLAGLKAAFLQIRKSEQDCIDFVCDEWSHLSGSYIASQIRLANGSVRTGTYWRFAEQCGYQLKKVKSTNGVAKPSVSERATLIGENLQKLYKVKGSHEDTFNEEEALTKELYDLGVSKETVAVRLLQMLAVEFGYDNNSTSTPRLALPGDTETAPVEDLLPGLVMRGRVGVMVGSYGVWKTTLAAILVDRVINGGTLPLMIGPVTKKGRALFIASDGADGAIPTIKNYAQRCGVPVERHGDKFHFFGAQKEAKQSAWSFCFKDLRRLVEHLQEYENDPMPVRLVVIDSLHAVMDLAGLHTGIGPMNDAMRLLSDIASKHDVSILLLHHTVKSDDGVVAGHAAIPQIADSVHLLKKMARTHDGETVRRWEVDKHRAGKNYTVDFIIKAGVGIVPVPLETTDNVHEKLMMEMYQEKEDGSSARNLANYLADFELKESRIKQELAAMRRKKLVKTANNRWFLTESGLKTAAKAISDLECLPSEDGSAEDAPINSKQERARKHQQVVLQTVEAEIKEERDANAPSADEVNQHLQDCFDAWDEPVTAVPQPG